MTYLVHWIHLDPSIHVDDQGDACIRSDQLGNTATSRGLLYVEAVEQIGREQHRPVVVTSLVAVA